MVDSGATNSFMNLKFLKSTLIPAVLKATPLDIHVIDGRPISSGAITHHTVPIDLVISSHKETISFDITSIGDYPVILGLPWLSRHNPRINWTRQSIVFSSPHCLMHCSRSVKPVEEIPGGYRTSSGNRQNDSLRHSTIDSYNQSTPDHIPAPALASPRISLVSAAAFRTALKTALISGTFDTQYIDHLTTHDEDEGTADPDTTTLKTMVPPEFHSFLNVFKKSNSDNLPEHNKYDHSMPLEDGTTPPFGESTPFLK